VGSTIGFPISFTGFPVKTASLLSSRVRLSVCPSQAGIKTTGRMELVLGMEASFYLAYTVL